MNLVGKEGANLSTLLNPFIPENPLHNWGPHVVRMLCISFLTHLGASFGRLAHKTSTVILQ